MWLSEAEWAAADGAAVAAGVETGALLREAAVRGVASVGRDVSAGRVRLRRRSAAVPVPSSAAPDPRVDRVAVALEAREAVAKSREVPSAGADRADLFRRLSQRRP